ncbi:hypothetical protein C8Q77DRAFT_1020302, partial [Trametes polyzona]
VWHYLTTLDKEVRFFWRRRFSGSTVLFLATRYSMLVWAAYGTTWKSGSAAH